VVQGITLEEPTYTTSEPLTPQISNFPRVEPPSKKDWHIQFVIPELYTFSDHVKEAISTGLITGRARREIIQVLRTYITAHTLFPKSEAYNAVCQKLVQKYPKLADDDGEQSYVRCFCISVKT